MRYRAYLFSRYRLIVRYSGILLALIGALNLVPMVAMVAYPEDALYAPAFLLASIPLIVLGLACWRFIKPDEEYTLSVQDGYVIVMLTWFIAIFASVIPLIFAGGLSFTQAWFEATSGWTTTGLSVVDVSVAPKIVLFHRSFLQLVGGAGFAIIALSVLPSVGNVGLSVAEGRTDQLAPHVRQSANIVLRMYAGYIIFGVVALKVAGMGWFDALNHAFAAIATGGFSTQPASIGHWNNALIEAIIIVLMLIGTTNFFLSYTLLKGKFRAFFRSGEVRVVLILIPAAFLLLLSTITLPLYSTFDFGVRVAIFEAVSAGTSTGFSIVSYTNWHGFGWLILIILMLIGGGSGSTSGGLKYVRIYVLYKAIVWEFKRAFMPTHMVNEPAIWQGERREMLADRQVRQAGVYLGIYLLVFVVGSGIFMAYGYGFQESLFEYASTLATAGLSIGITRADMPEPLLWFQSVTMLLGRLEFFAVIIGVFKFMGDAKELIFKRGQN